MDDNNDFNSKDSTKKNIKQTAFPNVSMPENMPILYSDFVLVYSNDSGIVINFAQSLGPFNQQNIVSRIGVSKEHAKKLIEVLKKQVKEEPVTEKEDIKD